MKLRNIVVALSLAGSLAALAGAAFLTRDHWRPWLDTFRAPVAGDEEAPHDHDDHPAVERVRLSPQARANLRLVVKPLQRETYWRTLAVPGTVIDRPGESDRGVTAPLVGVVTAIHAYPGDTVRDGAPLFTVRVVSELIHNTQAELFKTTREVQVNREQLERLKAVGERAIPQARLVELENQDRRLAAAVLAYRQELLTRGLTPEQISAAAGGNFVTQVTVVAPRRPAAPRLVTLTSFSPGSEPDGPAYEVQELKVHLGEQVQAGQTLCLLANHQALFVEGRAFKQESALLERAARQGWPVRATFADEAEGDWPPLDAGLQIRHLANTVDPASRTFAFYLPLTNPSRAYARDGKTFLVWRFRPGQRVRLLVPVAEMKDVFVLPAGAVVREGPDAYAFRQNGDFFERKLVHVVHEDRDHVVLADDGSLGAGQYVARNAAAALNRALKAMAAEGEGGHGHDHHGHDH